MQMQMQMTNCEKTIVQICLDCEKMYLSSMIICCNQLTVSLETNSNCIIGIQNIFDRAKNDLKRFYEKLKNNDCSMYDMEQIEKILRETENICKISPESKDKLIIQAWFKRLSADYQKYQMNQSVQSRFFDPYE
jgi:hypothetical protein